MKGDEFVVVSGRPVYGGDFNSSFGGYIDGVVGGEGYYRYGNGLNW